MKFLRIIFVLNLLSLFNCSAGDTFPYDDYAFLEENEWYTSYGLNGTGKVEFFRVGKYERMFQQEMEWDIYYLYAFLDDDKILELGSNLEYKLEYRDNFNRLVLDCITDGKYFDVVDRIGEINPKNKILGQWADMNKTDLRFENRELVWDDYVYLVYIGGPETYDSTVNDNTRGWFLLKYEGNGVFRSDGAFEDDKYRLEISTHPSLKVENSLLRFTPEYDHPDRNIETYVIYSKEYKRE
ncbi:MAG: hypothetical protein PF518_15530 [Spirochaetaceae bacterium]|jgi:hypothetical protein|nr:hypothetical protein [Spirochaetaceae bacterium]